MCPPTLPAFTLPLETQLPPCLLSSTFYSHWNKPFLTATILRLHRTPLSCKVLLFHHLITAVIIVLGYVVLTSRLLRKALAGKDSTSGVFSEGLFLECCTDAMCVSTCILMALPVLLMICAIYYFYCFLKWAAAIIKFLSKPYQPSHIPCQTLVFLTHYFQTWEPVIPLTFSVPKLRSGPFISLSVFEERERARERERLLC